MIDRKKNTDFLDGLRGLAAAYVVVGHARYLLAAGYADGFLAHRADYSTLGKIGFLAFLPFRYGHEAVLFFFVLSGFVIHLRQASGLAQKPDFEFRFLPYIQRRAKRLYPPLLLALALTFLCDSIGARYFPFIYSGKTGSDIINAAVQSVHDLSTLVGNLLFLMTAYFPFWGKAVPHWGSNGPLWSLHYEGWFYLFYPLLFPLIRKSLALGTLFFFVAFAAGFIPHPNAADLPFKIFGMMWIWWCGGILAEIHSGRIPFDLKKLVWLTLLIPAGILLKSAAGRLHLSESASDLLISPILTLGFCGLIACGFSYQTEKGFWKIISKLKWLGEMSYTLYVTHFPILLLLGAILITQTGENILPRSPIWILPGCAAVLLVAYLAHFLVERPFLSSQRKTAKQQ